MRKASDFYPTPKETIENILFNYKFPEERKSFLEPCAGNGNITSIVKEKFPNWYITSLELRPEEKENLTPISDELIIGDFLIYDFNNNKFDVIITNPPFSLAQEFINKSLSLLSKDGVCIMLLRTAMLESKKRHDWWQDKLPNGLYVLSKRPSFTGKGTDATSYSWFIWENGSNKQEIKVI